MKNVIVHQSRLNDSQELVEYFHNLGYEPLFISDRANLLTACSGEAYQKVFVEVSNFSDIRLINSIRKINRAADIVLIVKPSLVDIIDILQNNDYQVINSITNLSSSEQNQ